MADTRNDVLVIGAGVNGLTAACMLARRGRRVLVLERRERVGGLCAGEEFHPGYHSAGVHHDTACLRPAVVDALRLEMHGLELVDEPAVLSPQLEGPGLLRHRDPDAAEREIGAHSKRDAKAYREFAAFIKKARRVVEPVLNEPPPDLVQTTAGGLVGLARHSFTLRSLGERFMMELLRVPPMCVADWVREWFESELLNASLAAPAIHGTWAGPWSPGTATNLLVRECTADRAVRGGAAELVRALERAAAHLGVEVRTSAAVERINVQKGAAVGVVLGGGEEVDAGCVVSSADPKTTFLSLMQPNDVSHGFEGRIRRFRMRGTTAQVTLALSSPVEFACRPGLRVERAFTGADLDQLERAFDAVKYRRFSERPLLDVYVPTVSNPQSAPAGHDVVSMLVHFVPYDLAGGWTDEARERVGDAAVAELERYAPGAASAIVARSVLSPADIERRYGVTGGHVHHGEHGLDQLITRPNLDAGRYATPVENLYLCGGGAFPGGGATGAPGALAARVIGSRR